MKTRLPLLLVLAACGPKQQARDPRPIDFQCNDRRAAYEAVGTLMYQEQGIRLTCEGDLPRVEQYFKSDDGTERTRSGVISVTQWEKAWSNFANAGWRNLVDCDNANAGARDPFYTFEVADSEHTQRFTCQGNALPFPYDTLQQALDFAAGELPGEETAE